MRFTLKFSALLAMLLVGFSLLGGSGAGAQDMASPESMVETAELEGIQDGVARYYNLDYAAIMGDGSTPISASALPSGLQVVGGVVLEFDTADNAAAAFESLSGEVSESNETLGGDQTDVWDSGLGEQNAGYKASEETSGVLFTTAFTIFQAENYVYYVIATGSDVDVEQTITDMGTALSENEGSGPGEFNADGTSTGGLWDKFPAADDEMIADLIPTDEVVYPES